MEGGTIEYDVEKNTSIDQMSTSGESHFTNEPAGHEMVENNYDSDHGAVDDDLARRDARGLRGLARL